MPNADAILEDEAGRPALRFQRVLTHSPDRVWKALTDPAELPNWHPSPFELEPRVGGTVSYLPSEVWDDFPDGEVTEYDPPRLLGYTWGEEDTLRCPGDLAARRCGRAGGDRRRRPRPARRLERAQRRLSAAVRDLARGSDATAPSQVSPRQVS